MSIERFSTCPFKITPMFTTNEAEVTTTIHSTGKVIKSTKRLKFFLWLWVAFCYSSESEVHAGDEND